MPTYVDVGDYRRLFERSRTVDPMIRESFRTNLRRAGEIGASAARAGALAMHIPAIPPSTHPRPSGPHALRLYLSLNIGVSVGSSDISINQRALSPDIAHLTQAINRGTIFTHPTFGHRPRVIQRGDSYFTRKIKDAESLMQHEVANILDDLQGHLGG